MNFRGILTFFKSQSGKSLLLILMIFVITIAANSLLKDQREMKPVEDPLFNDEVTFDNNYKKFDDGKIKTNPNTSGNVEGITGNDLGSAIKNLEANAEAKKKAEIEKEKEQEAVKEKQITKEDYDDLKDRLDAMKVSQMQLKEESKKKIAPQPIVSQTSLFQANPPSPLAKRFSSSRFAPYGRLIKCQLINSVDSSNLESPVIAIVADDVYHNNKLIIPAGVEVHGKAKSSPIRDRIGTDSNWYFVWRTKDEDNGKELAVSGIALDYARDPSTGRWLRSDGSSGLRGIVIEDDEYAKLKFYAMQFVQGAAAGVFETLQNQSQPSNGNTLVDSNVNGNEDSQEQQGEDDQQIIGGVANGVQAAADAIAQDMLQEIEENGRYVRVTGGTYFYLYVQQTLDASKAELGASSGNTNLTSESGNTQSGGDDVDALTRLLSNNLRRAQEADRQGQNQQQNQSQNQQQLQQGVNR